MVELSPFDYMVAVNDIGFDFIAKKQTNGLYKIEGWNGYDKCLGLGKHEYTNWQEGINITYKSFYDKYILKL